MRLSGTAAFGSSTSAPSSLSTAVAPVGEVALSRRQWQPCRHHLLRCFALADLLGVSPTVRQQLAAAARTPPDSLGRALDTPESSPSTQAYALEHILAAAVSKRLLDGTDVANTSATTSVSGTERDPQQTARKRPTSSLTAPVWAAAWSEPPSTSPPGLQASEKLMLPTVLSSPEGVARVDALHSSFLPFLLVVLLQRVTGECGGGGSRDIHVPGVAAPKKTNGDNAVKADAPSSHLSVRHQRACRAALQQLLQLYMPLLLTRRRKACDVVSAIVEAVRGCSCRSLGGEAAAAEHESRKGIHRLVQQNLSCDEFKEWLQAARLLSDTLVASLYRVSRRDGATATAAADEDNLMEAQWTLEMAGCWLSAARMDHDSSASVAEERNFIDLFWWEGAQREAGVSASRNVAGPTADRGTPASAAAATHREGRVAFTTTAEVLALADVICAVVAETCDDMYAHDALPSQEQLQQLEKDGHTGIQCQRAPSSVAWSGSRTVAALNDVTTFFLTVHHDKGASGLLHTPSNSFGTATELGHSYALLLAERLEEVQCLQHRLLAAAERAVHRVLQQQHQQPLGALWKSPEMVVALCSVTAYQVRTQLHRCEQRMAELCTATTETAAPTALSGVRHVSPASFPSGSAATVAQKASSSDGEAAESARSRGCPSAGAPHTAAAPEPLHLGETLWSEAEEEEDATGQHAESQEGRRAHAHSARAGLLTHATLSPPSTSGAATTTTAAAADASILMPLHPPVPPSLSAPPSPVNVPGSDRCTPRTSGFSHAARADEALPAMHERDDSPAAADEDAEALELRTRGGGDYSYAPARSMEHLWELPACVPREWTPALATLMACCLLCLSPSSSTAATSRLAILLGVPLLSSCSAEEGFARRATATAAGEPTSAPLARQVAIPRPRFLDFAFSRHYQASTAIAAGGSARSSVCSSSSSSTHHSATGITLTVDRTGSGRATATAVGALAQWHLQGLIRQLRLPVNGRVLPSEQSGVDGRQGSHASVMPRSTGAAAGGASWLMLYSQATRSHACAPDATLLANRAALRSLPPPGGVLRLLDPVSLLASCFALMHLLQTHPLFFQQARLGGRTMHELRLGVLEARWDGEPGCATQMLQRHSTASSAVTVSVTSALGSLLDGTAARRCARGHSLWDGTYSAAADAAPAGPLKTGASDDHRHREHADAPLRAVAVDACGDGGDGRDEPASATCRLTEALLVAVSYVGCRALAAALARFAAPGLTSVASRRGGGIAAAATALSSQDLWCDALQAIAGALLEAHRAHKGGVAASRARAVAAVAARQTFDHGSTRACNDGTPASHASAAVSVTPWLNDSQRALCLGAVQTATPSYAAHLDGDAGRGSDPAASPSLMVAAVAPVPASLSTEAQFGIGAFFTALVRALLQLHASASEASADGGRHGQPPHWPPPLMCVLQCLYAVVSIIDDLLHDYANAPPAVLCDVLAMMLVVQSQQQPLSATVTVVGDAAPQPHASATCTMWEALHRTPFWDSALLGSVEAASRAWACAGKRCGAPSSGNEEESRNSVPPHRVSSLSAAKPGGASSAPHGPAPPQLSYPPWQSLLGRLPCSRDPCTTAWLPAAFRGSSRHRSSRTLLSLLAKEEDLLLAGPASAMTARAAAAVAEGDGEREAPMRRAGTVDEIRQLSIFLVSSARYAGWIERLCDAWCV
ncbi:hypothetical protein LSCM1_06891 [Leishmania martiniquensis]|uniref:Uncharacterized protein n=1 Tax=Leishmania martiniquensis TaxID=1580590 RepID=A0A836H149_9TRYP|nr:hypothetical protein LSCM1_06891 [Leishmania martiniquensis]